MTKIEPFKSVDEALEALDNGGRFYNIFTKADDGKITAAELGKFGGIFGDKQKMILLLDLLISELSEEEKKDILNRLDEDLANDYHENRPQILLPSDAEEFSMASTAAIISGTPHNINAESAFVAYLMTPIMVGEVATFVPIVMTASHNIYELSDHQSDKKLVIAHEKKFDRLPEKRIKVAGIFRSYLIEKEETDPSGKFFEVYYFQEIG